MRRTAFAVPAALALLGAAALPADAAPTAWKIGHVFTPSKSKPGMLMSGLSAVSAKETWAAGSELGAKGRTSGVISHHIGGHWRKTSLPAPLNGQRTEVDLIDASSPHNVWVVASVDLKTDYLLRWTGKKWVIARKWSSSKAGLSGLVAYGAHGVWVLGAKSWRFDGHSWRTYGRGLQAGTRVGSEVWAHNGTNLFHFTGGRWAQLRIPHLPSAPEPDGPLALAAITASSTHDVWLTGQGVLGAKIDNNPGAFALHFNGTAWQILLISRSMFFDGDGMADAQADGRGGVWTDDGTLHFTGGRWVKVGLPTYKGHKIVFGMPLTRVPGTHTVLGFGWVGNGLPWWTSVLIRHS